MESSAPKLNKGARSFKPKTKPQPEIVSESKYFKGVLPQAVTTAPPSLIPPGLNIKFENGELILPPNLPPGLSKMFMKAYEDGKLHEFARMQQQKEEEEEEMYALTEEEQALAEEFLAEQEAMEMCPYYLEGKCKYGKKCSRFHPSDIDEFSNKINFAGDRE